MAQPRERSYLGHKGGRRANEGGKDGNRLHGDGVLGL